MKPTSTFGQHARAVGDLEAENALLQARAEALEARQHLDKELIQNGLAAYRGLTEERDGYKALAERRGKALEPFSFCQAVQHKPAEYVTREMAIDAGEPTMEGTLLRGEVSGPCDTCDGCHARAALAATPEEAATR